LRHQNYNSLEQEIMNMDIEALFNKAFHFEQLSAREGLFLFENADTSDLMHCAHQLRMIQKPEPVVTWIIDRNMNTTNVCIANCKFCNFYRVPGHAESYVTDMDTYREKIKETIHYGGEQLLLQGGHNPELGLDYYTGIFKQIKQEFPQMKLHALGPPEIMHISQLEGETPEYILKKLIQAGLDSLPGAGAEILDDRVRRLISNGKCSADEWLGVMEIAHQLNLTTSATMMFGHIETNLERMEHLVKLREVQNRKPLKSKGFLAFIPWPFQDEGTMLRNLKGVRNQVTAYEYIRMIAISRIMLPNIPNIQASWLTVGKDIAQMCLYAGANDFGSIMIEENVVSAAGAPHRFTASGIQSAIREAGFTPQLRDQQYQQRALPDQITQQLINY